MTDHILLDRNHIWRPYTANDKHQKMTPVDVVSGDGAWLIAKNGERYLDASGSWWTCNLGHGHPRLREALRAQSEKIMHCSFSESTHENAVLLARDLLKRTPHMHRVFYSDNGSTAVEVGLKMAYQYWQQSGENRRQKFLSLPGAYHGDTFGAMSVSDLNAFSGTFASLLFSCEKPPFDPWTRDDWEKTFTWLRNHLADDKGEIAAVVIEPLVQGAAGMRTYDPKHLKQLRQACDENGALLIVDEVFTGFGRTGSFWACDQANMQADIIATAKGLSGGVMPFSATLANERVYRAFDGDGKSALMHGHTFYGNPLGCAIAREVLSIYEDEKIIENIPERASMIADVFSHFESRGLRTRHCGMVAAVDVGETGYHGDIGWRIAERMKAKNVLIRPLGNTIYIVPNLNIDQNDLHLLLRTLSEAVLAEIGE